MLFRSSAPLLWAPSAILLPREDTKCLATRSSGYQPFSLSAPPPGEPYDEELPALPQNTLCVKRLLKLSSSRPSFLGPLSPHFALRKLHFRLPGSSSSLLRLSPRLATRLSSRIKLSRQIQAISDLALHQGCQPADRLRLESLARVRKGSPRDSSGSKVLDDAILRSHNLQLGCQRQRGTEFRCLMCCFDSPKRTKSQKTVYCLL